MNLIRKLHHLNRLDFNAHLQIKSFQYQNRLKKYHTHATNSFHGLRLVLTRCRKHVSGYVFNGCSCKSKSTSAIQKYEEDVEKNGPDAANNTKPGVLYHYFGLKRKYPTSEKFLLFYQIGDFYEFYGQDAEIASQVLGIGLTNKRMSPIFSKNFFARFSEVNASVPGTLSFTGIPVTSFETGPHLRKLVTDNSYKLVICDQYPTSNPSPSNSASLKSFERKVSRIITPGTISEESILSSSSNNFLLSMSCLSKNDKEGLIGIAWIDISTGDISSITSTLEAVDQYFTKLSPKEILIEKKDESFLSPIINKLNRAIGNEICITKASSDLSFSSGNNSVREILSKFTPKSEIEEKALFMLMNYVQETQVESSTALFNSILKSTPSQLSLNLDSQTFRSLEILTNINTGKEIGSLFGVLKGTETAFGARLLSRWLQTPLVDLPAITERLDALEYFISEPELNDTIKKSFKGLVDLERNLNSLLLRPTCTHALKRMGIIKKSLQLAQNLKPSLIRFHKSKHVYLSMISNDISEIDCSLLVLLENTIINDPPPRLSDGNFISEDYDIGIFGSSLKEVRAKKHILRNNIHTLEKKYRSITGTMDSCLILVEISSLKIISYRNDNLLVEIPLKEGPLKGYNSLFIRETKTSQVYRYQTIELNSLDVVLTTHNDECSTLELEIYYKLYAKVIEHSLTLRSLIKAFALLDLFTSMAKISTDRFYVKPKIDTELDIIIRGGRHPVVEKFLSTTLLQFVKNDCLLLKNSKFALITGPNMGGKSTFLRQNALIVLMAQCGFYVPADEAKIGIVDSIYTRIGASDSLTTNESTFMLEMKEMALILKNATPKSLVIVDEVGRGTSPFEGKAIARAVGEYLYKTNQSRVLFATHFYMEFGKKNSIFAYPPDNTSSITFWKTSALVDEKIDGIVFLHKISQGLAKTSHRLHVARLAGMPENVISIASSQLSAEKDEQFIEEKNIKIQDNKITENFCLEENQQINKKVDMKSKQQILSEIKNCNLDSISEIEALDLLFKWKELIVD